MKSEFCDWEPCPWLKKLITRLLSAQKGEPFGLVVSPQKLNQPMVHGPQRLNLWYCPFCGTRIYDNKEILGWVERRRGSS